MALLWVLLGAAVGGITVPRWNAIGIVSGALAGIILLLPWGPFSG
jgi:hypothetical protein